MNPEPVTYRVDLKQFVIDQAVSTAIVVACVYFARKLSDPDSFRLIRMRGALTVKKFAETQADMWTGISHKAATSYNKVRI